MPSVTDNLAEKAAAAAHRAAIAKANAAAKVARLQGKAASAMLATYKSAETGRTRSRTRQRGGSAQSHLNHWRRDAMRRDGQDLLRNHVVARAIASALATTVIGKETCVYAATEDEAWNDLAYEYLSGLGTSIDFAGESTLNELARQAILALCSDGDVGVIDVKGGTIQLIEGELIANPAMKPDSPTLVGGLELTRPGGPVARYHVREWRDDGATASLSTRAIPAEAMRLLVATLMLRIGQRRGEPMLQAIVRRLEHLDGIDEAVLMAVRLGASPGLIKIMGQDGFSLAQDIEDSGINDSDTEVTESQIEPGMLLSGETGAKYEQVVPTHPSQPLTPWQMQQIRLCCADIGVPVELVFFYHEKNFHASRASFMGFWKRTAEPMQAYFAEHFYTPIYRHVIREAIVRGDLPYHEDWARCKVQCSPMPMLDPEAEGKAAKLLIESMLSTFDAELSRFGVNDWEAHFKQVALERDRMKALGLQMAVTPGSVGKQSAGSETKDAKEEETEDPEKTDDAGGEA